MSAVLKLTCKWCGSALGVLVDVKVYICPRCDYADGDRGPWVEDQ